MTDDTPIVPPARPGKAPDALRTIGEVGTLLGIRQHVLRYWEDQFPMLRPLTRSGGRRYYRPADIALLRTIHRLVDEEGYTLRGARLAIENGTADGVPRPGPSTAETIAPPIPHAAASLPRDVVDRLRQVRRTLTEALADI